MKIFKFLGILAAFTVVGAEKQTRRAQVQGAEDEGDRTVNEQENAVGQNQEVVQNDEQEEGDGTGIQQENVGGNDAEVEQNGEGEQEDEPKTNKSKKWCPACPPRKPEHGSSCEQFEKDCKTYNHESQSKKCKDRCPYGERCCNKKGDCFKNVRAICLKETKKWSIEEDRCSEEGYEYCGTDGNNYIYQKVCGNDGKSTDWKIYDKCQAERAGYTISFWYTPAESKKVKYGRKCGVDNDNQN